MKNSPQVIICFLCLLMFSCTTKDNAPPALVSIEFPRILDDIKASVRSNIDQNLYELDKRKNLTKKNEFLHSSSLTIHELGMNLIEHIDFIKAKTFSISLFGAESGISESVYSNGEFLIGLDSIKVLVGIDNYNLNSDLMIGNPDSPKTGPEADGYNYTAEALRNKLLIFKKTLLEGTNPLDSASALKLNIQKAFMLPSKDEVKDGEEQWTVKNFYHVPLAATTAMLTAIQSQVFSAASDFLEKSKSSLD